MVQLYQITKVQEILNMDKYIPKKHQLSSQQ
jgi:hypothetical protein